MALFKILRGESVDLANLEVTDGFAYFTPESGKFYIDYGKTGDSAIMGRSSTDYPLKTGPNGEKIIPNRICVNDTELLTPVDDLIGSVTENILITNTNITIEDGKTKLNFPDLMADLLNQKRLIGLQAADNGLELVPGVHYTCIDEGLGPQLLFDYVIRVNSLVTLTYDIQYINIFDQLFKLSF